jgi:hypothetical protein
VRNEAPARGGTAQPEAGIDVGKAGADHAGGIGFTVEIHLDLWLQDEPLREQNIVGGIELGGQMALAAHIAGELDIKKVRRETLNVQRPQLRVGRESMSLRSPPCRSK